MAAFPMLNINVESRTPETAIGEALAPALHITGYFTFGWLD